MVVGVYEVSYAVGIITRMDEEEVDPTRDARFRIVAGGIERTNAASP